SKKRKSRRDAEALDLPFEFDPARLLDARAHRFAEFLEIGAGRVSLIDEEIAVHLGDLGVADAEAATAGAVDELPRFVSWRILEGRATGAALDRLHLLAIGRDLVHLGKNLCGLTRLALEQRLGEDHVVRRAAVAIGVAERGNGKHMNVTLAIDRARLDENLFRLAPMRAAIHAERAADAAGNAAIEGEACDPRVGGRARHFHVRHGSAGSHPITVLGSDLAETAPEPDHDAFDAAVAHKKIGAEPDDRYGNGGGDLAQEVSEIGFVGGGIEHFRRATCPEPGKVLERGFGHKPPLKLGQARHKPAFEVASVQARPPCPASFLGKALIQSVIVPAPRPTTVSPPFATEAMVSTSDYSSDRKR